MLDARAFKSNGGVFFHGEEGVGTQMGITQYIMRIDTGRVASTQELAGFCSSI
jgi:hypothetical protein